jgi:phage terminase large subunit-like protein
MSTALDKNYPKSHDDPELEELLSLCYANTQVCAKTLFPELFPTDWAEPHNQIFRLIDNPNRKKKAIAAPRGIGKTTIARTKAKKGILFHEYEFIVYISKSATFAEMQTENIKRELLSNAEVKEMFGNIKINENPDIDEAFSKSAWVAFGRTLVLPRGAGQQIRGLNWNGKRPQLIIVDDLEDKKLVQSEENRKYLKDWFYSDTLNSVNKYLDDWEVLYIDTIKHEDALLANLVDSSDWETIVLSICDENFESLVPEYMSTEEVKAAMDAHREDGMIDSFYMEYMNQPISTEDAVFKPDYVNYYRETDAYFMERLRQGKIENIVIVDPAKSVKLHSAESGIVGIGIDAEDSRYYIRDILGVKLHPDELIDETFAMASRLGCVAIGLEVTSLDEFITQPFKNEMFKRGTFFELVEIKAVGKKEDRIAALAPLYRAGYVYHNANCCGPLEAQLFSFPKPKRFDLMDALAYLVKMLEMGLRYFQVPDHIDDPELEFAELGITGQEDFQVI